MKKKKNRTPSSSVAIGTAMLFLAVATLVSFLSDDPTLLGHTWSLRGTLVPSARADER